MELISLPRSQLRYLVRHFFGRFFDTELIATLGTEMNLLFVQIAAMLVMPGLLISFLSITKYSYLAWFPIAGRDKAVLLDMHLSISISMILTGFITTFEWEALFPDRKDYNNLSPLPIKPRKLFFAKVISLALFVVLFHIAINGLPMFLFPGMVLACSLKPGTAGFNIPPTLQGQYLAGHAVGLFLSTLFIFSSLITLRAIFLLVFPARMLRLASRFTQLSVLLILLCALFGGGNAAQLIAEENRWVFWLPPFWFLGIFETMIGHHSIVVVGLAKIAYAAAALSGSLALFTYTVSYQMSMRKGFQSAGVVSYPVTRIKKIWAFLLHKTILRKPIERASFHFIGQTAFRRQEHVLYWGSFIAVGAAFVFSDLSAVKAGSIAESSKQFAMLLSSPLIISFFILVGLRFIFTVPADLNANWVFKTIGVHLLKRSVAGVRKFMIGAVLIPLLVVFTPWYLVIWPFRMVFIHIVFVSILSLILIELLLLGFPKLPFTCSYLPGKGKIILLWPVYVLTCYLYSYGMTFVERWMLADAGRYVIFILIAAAVWYFLIRRNASFLKQKCGLVFEETAMEQRVILSIED
jgi:hypothetical protein